MGAPAHQLRDPWCFYERGPGSPREAEEAAWTAERLSAAGTPAQVEPASYSDGYARPTATLVSFNRHKALSNYHLMSDTAENIDFDTVAQALLVTDGVARELAASRWL